MDYKEVIIKNLNNALPSAILLIASIALFVKVLKELLKFNKSRKMIKHKKKEFISCILIFIVSIILIVHFITDFGPLSTQMTLDYYNNDFLEYEGMIYKSIRGKGMADTAVNIQGRIFYLSRGDEYVFREYKGYYCKIVYGSKSKFIVDYELLE